MPTTKRRKRRLIRLLYPLSGVLIALGMIVTYLYVNDEPIPYITSEQGVAPELLAGVGLDGLGGDALLNRQKNRISLPKTYTDYTIPQIIAIDNEILSQMGARDRKNWYPSARLYAEEREAMGVRVEGYLLRAKQSGVESANGYIDSLRDYHLWIADKPTAERNTTMIAEVTPRWKVVYPEWKLKTFKKLAEQKAKVRISGWLLWDQEHGTQVARSRGTSWEIHPMTKFEVWTNNEWRELAPAEPEKDSIEVSAKDSLQAVVLRKP